ncbi:MAG: heparinase II/III family protein [Rubrobacter sp.]
MSFLRGSALTMGFLSLGLGAASRKAVATQTTGHPRVIADRPAFDAINASRETDAEIRADYEELKRIAETEIMPSALVEYEPTGAGEKHKTGRELVHRLFTLGLLYRLDPTENAVFADKAIQEMSSAAGFPDWQPQSALDLGEITTAMSVGYDWCFDRMADDERRVVRDAILGLGIKDYMSTPNRNYAGNWNHVIQSGIGVGCMAIKGETGEERTVAAARNRVEASLPTGLAAFSPHGGTAEGVNYWSYGWQYLTHFFRTTLTAEGAYSPLVDREGLRYSGYFPMYCTGPTGELWQFADNGKTALDREMTNWVAWQGEKYDDSALRWFGNRGPTVASTADGTDRAASLLYRTTGGAPPVVLDRNFDGAGVVSFRSAWQDPNALFAGFKWGGHAERGHVHLDRGSFVITAMGRRWVKDLGPDSYSLPGYFDSEAQRWSYYRCRAEGHNTLVIPRRPFTAPDQKRLAAPTRVKQSLNSDNPFLISDLTPVYGLRSVRRGIKLPDRNKVIVQDEVKSDEKAVVWWFMHTMASIALSSDGRSATLSDGSGKKLWLTIQAPSAAAFSVMDAVPLPGSPNPAGQNPNRGVRKLAIRLARVRRARITVLAVPLDVGESAPTSIPPVVPLAYW